MTLARIAVRVSEDRTAFAILASDGLDPRPIQQALEALCTQVHARLKTTEAQVLDDEGEPFVMRSVWVMRVTTSLTHQEAEDMRDRVASALGEVVPSAFGFGQ